MNIEYFYKYGSFNEFSESVFSTPTVWFSAPSKLNDPFECRPEFIFQPTSEQSIEMLKGIIKKRNPHMTDHDVTANAVGELLRAHKENRNFNWEGQSIRDYFDSEFEKIGLCCLSMKPDNILMWSHYANYHYGYCLQFEGTNHTPFFGEAQPVKYKKDYPIVDCINMTNEEQVDLVFLTKYRQWAYEKEYRIINIRQGPGLREYPAHLLKGVIFGLRMPNKEKEQIRQWLGHRGHSVKLYQAVQSKSKFAIEIREIN